MGHFHPDGQELLIDTITRKLGYKFYEAQIDLLTPSMKRVTLSYLIKASAGFSVIGVNLRKSEIGTACNILLTNINLVLERSAFVLFSAVLYRQTCIDCSDIGHLPDLCCRFRLTAVFSTFSCHGKVAIEYTIY